MFAAGLSLAGTAAAQGGTTVHSVPMQQQQIVQPLTNDPRTWPASFNGTEPAGPVQWVEAAAAVTADPFTNAVSGGQEGSLRLQVCRAVGPDGGIHVGFARVVNLNKKYECHFGWGGKNYADDTRYQMLMVRPEMRVFTSQTWTSPATMPGYVGGKLGNSGMRVCRARHGNNLYAGKEWAGKCNITDRKQEIAATSYEVLQIGFDKARWYATTPEAMAQAKIVVTMPSGGLPSVPKLDLRPSSTVSVTTVPAGTVLVDLGLMTEAQGYFTFLASAVAPATAGNGAALHVQYAKRQERPDYVKQRGMYFVREVVERTQHGEVFRLKLAGTNLCVDVASGSYQPGSKVHLWTCHDGLNQRWVGAGGRLISRLTPPGSMPTLLIMMDEHRPINNALCLHAVSNADLRVEDCKNRRGAVSLLAYQ
ncbi:MAG TPA: RICIN domain-containing protein [Burkholderiales bacterium]|nr:RICIN domain-containing protein [Burkholderiales bacterium]